MVRDSLRRRSAAAAALIAAMSVVIAVPAHAADKPALSTDDKIGASGRRPFQITGEEVRTRVHMFRAQSDAILVGIGTALADNPQLNCRLPGMEPRSPVRVILDRHMPAKSRRIRHNDVIAHVAVVGDVRRNHQKIVIADSR